MRALYLAFFACLFSISVFAQTVPQEINYQAVVRDSLGAPLPEGPIEFTIRFLDDQSNPIVPVDIINTQIQKFGVVSSL